MVIFHSYVSLPEGISLHLKKSTRLEVSQVMRPPPVIIQVVDDPLKIPFLVLKELKQP